MKATLALVAILAAVSAVTPAVIKATPRTGLDLGFTTSGDRLLYSVYANRTAEPNTVQQEDVVYIGNATTVISKILATELVADRAAIWITAGGLARSHVTARIHAYRGEGYNYLFQVWGQ